VASLIDCNSPSVKTETRPCGDASALRVVIRRPSLSMCRTRARTTPLALSITGLEHSTNLDRRTQASAPLSMLVALRGSLCEPPHDSRSNVLVSVALGPSRLCRFAAQTAGLQEIFRKALDRILPFCILNTCSKSPMN
jgi:hypothetical protein